VGGLNAGCGSQASAPVALTDPFGSGNGPVVLEQYSDFECPACATQDTRYGTAIETWVAAQNGQATLAYYDLVLSQHPYAAPAARAARCAGAQAAYGPARLAIFANQSAWVAAADPVARVQAIVRGTVPDTTTFNECLVTDSAAGNMQFEVNMTRALALRVAATPTMVIRAANHMLQIVGPASPDAIARLARSLGGNVQLP
jgi:protein-disulfide isomerase